MKQKFKHYLKLGIFLFGISLILTTCEKDDAIFAQDATDLVSYPNVTYFSKNTVPLHIMNTLNISLNNSLSRTSKNNSSVFDYEASFGTILTDRIMLSINDEGIENYTFKVEFDDNDPKTFYNLILRKNADDSFSEPYLKKYTMSDAFFEDYSNNNYTLSSFEGNYQNYTISDAINIDILLGKTANKVSSNCIVPVTDDGDIGDNGNPVDGGNPSGGGGPSGGPGGPSGGNPSGGGTQVTCNQRLVANVCNGGGGHYGELASCTGSFKGSISLITTCSDGSVDVQDLNKSANPSGGCPNDDGNVGVMDDDFIDPCKQFKQLATNTELKEKLQDLKDKTATDDKETAYVMKKSGIDQYDYDIKEGESGDLGIDPELGDDEEIDGFIHNHINDSEDRDISIFSPHDLYALYKWLKNDNIKDRKRFIYIVTTAQGTTYALHIKSKSKFIAFGDVALEGLQNEDNNTLPHIYGGKDGEHFPEGIKNGNTNAVNEKNFAKMLYYGSNFEDTSKRTGLELYKSDANFENWAEIEYNPDTNNVSPNGC